MLFMYLVTALWQSLYLCSAQCDDIEAIIDQACLTSQFYPSNCNPVSSLLNDCKDKDLKLWKEGIGDVKTSDDIYYIFIKCQTNYTGCGYMPCDQIKIGASGVKFLGIDLGQPLNDLPVGVPVPSELGLSYYEGKKGYDAAKALCNQELAPANNGRKIETKMDDFWYDIMDAYTTEVKAKYDVERVQYVDTKAFDDLSLGIRTVLISIRDRWGANTYYDHDTFWNYVFSNDFENAVDKLRSWDDENCATDIRLSKEANVMEASLGTCNAKSGVDCVFLLDESGSVEADNFELAKDWVLQFVESFHSSIISDPDKAARFGLSTFSNIDTYFDDFYLNQYSTLGDYTTAIKAVQYAGGQTYLGDALTKIGTNQFKENKGMRAKTKGISRSLIVMTDGLATDDTAITDAVASLKPLNLNIFAIGIASASTNTEQLKKITDEKYIYTSTTFAGLDDILDSITTQTCYAPIQLTSTSNEIYDKIIGDGKTTYFEFDTTSVTQGQKIKMRITQKEGCVYVYASYCVDNPSYYFNAYKYTSCNQEIKEIILEPTSAQCSDNKIYVALEGRRTKCTPKRRLLDGTSSFDLVIGTCNSTEAGCVSGTNYDPTLDNDLPYDFTGTLIEADTNSTTATPTDVDKPGADKSSRQNAMDWIMFFILCNLYYYIV